MQILNLPLLAEAEQGAPQVPRLHLGLLLEERRDHAVAGTELGASTN